MIIVKQEIGTDYSFVNGTKVISLTGLTSGLTQKSIRNVEIIRTGTSYFVIYPSKNGWIFIDNGGGSYNINYSAFTSTTALATGDELVIKIEQDSGRSLWNSIKTVADNVYTYLSTTLVNKVDSIQTSINALAGVSWNRNITVNEGSVAFVYIDQPVTINTATVDIGNVTQIRSINSAGAENIVNLPFIFNPGMSIKVYTDNVSGFTCSISGSKSTDTKMLIQNIALAANPYPGLPGVGHCVWDVENTQMRLVQNICTANAGLNVGLYDNLGKIIQEFVSKMAHWNSAVYNTINRFALNTPNFYYIQSYGGLIWYNKTTKVFGIHATIFQGGIYIESKNKAVFSAHNSNLYVVDCETNIVSTITLTIANSAAIVYCSEIDRVAVSNAGAASMCFVDVDGLTQDGAELTVASSGVFMSLSEDNNYLYCCNAANISVNKIELSGKTITTFSATGMVASLTKAIYEKNGYIYILGGDNRTWVGNAVTLAYIKFIDNTTGAYSTLRVGDIVWNVNFTGAGNGLCNYLNINTEDVGTPVTVNDFPRFLTHHPQTEQIYIGCVNDYNSLSIITP